MPVQYIPTYHIASNFLFISHSIIRYWPVQKVRKFTSTNVFFFLVAPILGSLIPLLEHRNEFPQFLDQGQSVGLLGRVISSSQGLYLYTNTEKRTHIHKPLNIHALSGIGSHGPGFRASEDSARLKVRPHYSCS
jgi:hypothetical protein